MLVSCTHHPSETFHCGIRFQSDETALVLCLQTPTYVMFFFMHTLRCQTDWLLRLTFTLIFKVCHEDHILTGLLEVSGICPLVLCFTEHRENICMEGMPVGCCWGRSPLTLLLSSSHMFCILRSFTFTTIYIFIWHIMNVDDAFIQNSVHRKHNSRSWNEWYYSILEVRVKERSVSLHLPS